MCKTISRSRYKRVLRAQRAAGLQGACNQLHKFVQLQGHVCSNPAAVYKKRSVINCFTHLHIRSYGRSAGGNFTHLLRALLQECLGVVLHSRRCMLRT
jgi:hypothetical protein